MFKIAAFDMDGTIADTIPMCIKAFRNSVSPYTDHELSREEILLYRRYGSGYKRLPRYRRDLLFSGMAKIFNADILEEKNPNHVFYYVNDLCDYFNRKW